MEMRGGDLKEHILRSSNCLGRVGEALICFRLSESSRHSKMSRVATQRMELGSKAFRPVEGKSLDLRKPGHFTRKKGEQRKSVVDRKP